MEEVVVEIVVTHDIEEHSKEVMEGAGWPVYRVCLSTFEELEPLRTAVVAVRSLPMRRCLRSSASCSMHLQELQCVAMAGGGEAGHRLGPHGGQPELVAQLPDLVLYGH